MLTLDVDPPRDKKSKEIKANDSRQEFLSLYQENPLIIEDQLIRVPNSFFKLMAKFHNG